MCRRAVCALLWVGAGAGFGAPAEIAVPEDLLPRFRAAIGQTLRRLPDYTCIQTIARSRKEPGSAAFQPFDTLRVQVGLIGGRERHNWSDATGFDDRELRDLARRGIVGTGNFAGHIRHVFLSQATTFAPRGAVNFHGRMAARYEYEVPVEYSRYKISVPPAEAEVGVRGSFWVDLETADLLGLEIVADEIPPELGMMQLSEAIRYARVAIGDSDFLLPASSQLTLASLDGEEFRNQVAFAECRQYQTESTVRFDGEDKAPAAAARPGVVAALPGSTVVELSLSADIDPEKAVLGDPIRAVLARPVRDGAQVLVPEGAVVHGRLVRLERAAQPFEHYVVGLEFHTIETAGAKFDFQATMQDAGPASGLLRQAKRLNPVFAPKQRGPRLDILVREKPRGEGVLHWDVKHPLIRRGLKMRWFTAERNDLVAAERK